jgi:hypothetical protein
MFNSFPKEDVTIEKQDGSIVGPYKALFDKKTIFPSIEINIDDGDILVRKLPGGKTERYVISDTNFSQGLARIPAHWTCTTTKASIANSPKAAPNIVIHSAHGVQIGDNNTQNIINYIQALQEKIDLSNAPEAEKAEAKSRLANFLGHPLVTTLLGVGATAILGQ